MPEFQPESQGRRAGSGCGCRRFVQRRQRERDDGAAVGADGEMGQRLLALVSWQSVLDEGAELVRVWMLPGLDVFAHGRSNSAVVAALVLSKNDLVCEVCSKVRRFISRSRGSVPRASSGGALAEAAGLEVVEQLLSNVGDQTLQPAADGGFVNVEDAGDLQQRLAVEKI